MAMWWSGAALMGRRLLLALTLALGCVGSASAQNPPASASEPPPAKINLLLELLDDPAVRDWLSRQAATPAPTRPALLDVAGDFETLWSTRLAAIEKHFGELLLTIPRLPDELAALAAEFSRRLNGWSWGEFLGAIALLVAAAIAVVAAVRRVGRKVLSGKSLGTEAVAGRLRKVALFATLNLGEAVAAAIAVGVCFLIMSWPPSLDRLVVPYAAAGVAFLLVLAALNTVFARGLTPAVAEELRAVPLSHGHAMRWWRRLLLFAALFLFGWATAIAVNTLGGPPQVRRLLVYLLGISLVVLALDMTWRAPASAARRRPVAAIAVTALVLLTWSAWVAGAIALLGLLLAGALLCLGVAVQRLLTTHLLRAPADAGQSGVSPVLAVAIDRTGRAVLIMMALALVLHFWRIDFLGVVGDARNPLERVAQAAMHALVVLLIVDLIWRVLNAVIEKALTAKSSLEGGAEDAQRQARLRTLLPILRNVLGVALLVIGGLMVLAAFGVEIGPLVAGAGVVGVAVGFGAQTLVRDVFSGIFYLLDDAFRVGEYVQSGSYRGTVEAFSLRSVKLRHHRGPLFTVPFGELGAVQNMSRDWVIDKMVISVAYGSDFDKAKKIVKQIGRELAEDPDLGPDILAPLKMQGVEGFGDFGVTLRLKTVTKPGKQFVLRRRANSMIKKRFDEAGIAFAVPVVQVAGEGPSSAGAAAYQAVASAREAPAGG